MRFSRLLVTAIVFGLALFVGPTQVAYGATLTVDSTADTSDFSTADGVCDTDDSIGDGPCTLRAAIEQANFDAGTDTIAFSIAGAGPHTISPGSALPLITDQVIIDGSMQPGFVATPIIELDGSSTALGVSGLIIAGGGSIVRGLVINGFGGNGITLAGDGGHVIEGNFIGTDVTGTLDLGNRLNGVATSAPNNLIGGTIPGSGNLISGNNNSGVSISLANGNRVEGNLIGTDSSGTVSLGNSQNGVIIVVGATNNVIGGTSVGAGNVISGNGTGIQLFSGADGNFIQGNFIGTDSTGLIDIGNTSNGVIVIGSIDNLIGGSVAGARNVISGNNQNGVHFESSGASGNEVEGNFIGTDVTGTSALGNSGDGIHLNGAPSNIIGGTASGARNIISGNNNKGVVIIGSTATGNTIQGNYIGTDVTGSTALGNTSHGVMITSGASSNTIGGSLAGAGNTIAFNGGDGVYFESGTGNLIDPNSIHSNTGLGIDLGVDGVDTNDLDDPDVGANNLQNYPLLNTAFYTAGSTAVVGSLNSLATTMFNIEFFSNSSCDGSGFGEGETFVGSTNVTTDGTSPYDAAINVTLMGVSVGDFLTATATDPSDNTSEFSACEEVLLDSDGDGVPDTTDNCPNTSNPGQENTDGDPYGNACDNCPTTPTDWFVYPGDTDCDGFADTITYAQRASEAFVGTDPNDSCADTTTPNDERGPAFGEPLSPWVTDTNDDGITTLGDVLAVAPYFNSPNPNPNYWARFDWNGDGKVTLSDVLAVSPFFNKVCVP